MADDVTWKDRLVSAGLWAVGGSWLLGAAGGLSLIQERVGVERVDGLCRIYTKGQILLSGNSLRHVVHPDIDPKQPYLFFQNHVNHFDHCVLYNATPHFKQGIENEDHFAYPIYGRFMRTRGTIPVAKNRFRRILKDMKREVLERDHSLIVFPEGGRTRDGHIAEFQRGVFFIARQIGVPIVPVAVTGLYEVMNANSLVIRPGHQVTVYCEKPVETGNVSTKDLDSLIAAVRRPMVARVEAYRQSLGKEVSPEWDGVPMEWERRG